MHLCLFEDEHVPFLRPLVETRPVYDLRLGIRTILETTRRAFAPDAVTLHTRSLVAPVTAQAHPNVRTNDLPDGADVLFVNGRFVAAPSDTLSHIQESVRDGEEARAFTLDDTLVAAWMPEAHSRLPDDLLDGSSLPTEPFSDVPSTSLEDVTLVRRPWDLLDTLRPALHRDAATWRDERPSTPLPHRAHATVHESAVAVQPERIFLGTGAEVRPGAILNAENGPIVLDENATVFEHAVLQGPCYVGPKTQIKVGADVEGAAFGHWCKVGGEVHDTIIQSLSNKTHPGFLGHAYLGRWCNLGADTNNSNLRNDYGDVSAYAPANEKFVSTDRQFAGLFMGDHSKCGINTMFDTGSVVGTFCNLYGGDFPPRYVPPFSWGGPSVGFTDYRLQKALAVAERVMARRNVSFTDADEALLSALYERTADERTEHHG